jgi:hypothetical protein
MRNLVLAAAGRFRAAVWALVLTLAALSFASTPAAAASTHTGGQMHQFGGEQYGSSSATIGGQDLTGLVRRADTSPRIQRHEVPPTPTLARMLNEHSAHLDTFAVALGQLEMAVDRLTGPAPSEPQMADGKFDSDPGSTLDAFGRQLGIAARLAQRATALVQRLNSAV